MTMPTFNSAVTNLNEPAIPLAGTWAASYSGPADTLIDLSQAVPDYPPPERLQELLAEAAGSTASFGYGAIEGEDSLRSAYARQVSSLYQTDVPVAAAETLVTSGCNQAFVASLMSLVGNGEQLLLPNPSYFNHAATASMLGIEPIAVNCVAEHGFVPQLEELERVWGPQVKALALVSPNNPTGAVYRPADLDMLLAWCQQRGIWLIIDETYRDFLGDASAAPHQLFNTPDWQHNLVQLYSFSKAWCIPGQRLGAIVAGVEVLAEIAKVMDNLQICAPRAGQLALATLLEDDAAVSRWLQRNRQEIASRATVFAHAIDALPGWRIASLGGYFAYVTHPYQTGDSQQIAAWLTRTAGVLTLPGAFFGPDQEAYLRIAFANVTAPVLQSLPDRLRQTTELSAADAAVAPMATPSVRPATTVDDSVI